MNRALLLLVCLGVFSGCVTRSDIRGLQTDLYNIQKDLQDNLGNVKDQTDTVQTTQADLLNTMQDLSGNLAALRSDLADSQVRMRQLSQRLDDLEASLSARMDAQIELLSGSKFVESPLPSTLFNLANSDFSRGKYSEALKGFKNYLKTYPRGEQVVEAKIKIADSLARQELNREAILAYDEVFESHPKDPLAATALLRKGQLQETTNPLSAIKTYELVVKNYPFRPDASVASERLNTLKNKIQK